MKSETLTPKQRKKIFQSIPCKPGCGNCCPTTCAEFDQEARQCKAHPTKVGEEEALRRRGLQCERVTAHMALTHCYFCPPVVERIKKEMPLLVIEPELSESGAVMIKNARHVLGESREIRGYPSTKELHFFPQAFFNLFIHSK